jgi:hypothetical protein
MDDQKNSALAPTRTRRKPSNQSKNAKWTPDENERLMKLVAESGTPNWNDLTNDFPGKSPQQIAERFEKVLNPILVKGSWTREEDELIIKFVQEKGTKDWTKLATLLPGRIGKQCRERWRNHLDPDVNREPWTENEDHILIDMYEKIGSKWVKIADHLPGRSDNAIKNRWNSTLKKRLEYERNGLARPKRGRPSQKAVHQRVRAEAQIKSDGDMPKPDLESVRAMLREQDPFESTMTPQISVPLSPFMFSTSSPMKPWSPSRTLTDFASVAFSPNMFSPSLASMQDDKEIERDLHFGFSFVSSSYPE